MSASRLVPSSYSTIGPFFLKPLVDGFEDLTLCNDKVARGKHILLAGRVVEEGNVGGF